MINIEKLLKSKHIEVQSIDVNDVTGVFVKNFRQQQNFSQAAMANILGVSKKCIEKWEQGKNNISGSSRVLLKLLFENPELIEKVYSAKVYQTGEKSVDYRPVAQDEFRYDEPINYEEPKWLFEFSYVANGGMI